MPNNGNKNQKAEAGRKGGMMSGGGNNGGGNRGGNNSNSRSESLEGNKNAAGPHNVSPEGRKKMSEGGRKGGEK